MITERFPMLRRDCRAKVPLLDKTGAVLYCRVSTGEQLLNYSLETQERDCRALCEREGLTVSKMFIDAKSAKTAYHRPEFQAMLAYCRKHHNVINAVVVYAVNRFCRNQLDHLMIRDQLRQRDIRLLSATERFDDSTPEGRLQENIVSMFAQFDNEKRSDRTKAGMRTAMEAGKWCHKPPVGYMSDASVPGGLRRDPDRAHLIRQGFEMYASGSLTKAAVLATITALGLNLPKNAKPVSLQTFDKILRSPVYAGWIVSDKSEIMLVGKFEPIVEIELFDRVQQQLRAKGPKLAEKRSRHKEDFPLRVFVRCGTCGKGITGSFATGRKGRKYPYYTCRSAGCRAVKFSRDELHQLFIERLHSLGVSGSFIPLFREILEGVWKHKMLDQTKLQAQVQGRIADLESRKRKLTDAMLDGRIQQAVYEEEMSGVGTAIQKLRAETAEQLPKIQEVQRLLDFAEWMLDRVAGLWNTASMETRMRIQTALFPDGITVGKERFGTASTSTFFSALEPIPVEKTTLASPRGFEPLLSP
jgi:site-specific DNA recombinase